MSTNNIEYMLKRTIGITMRQQIILNNNSRDIYYCDMPGRNTRHIFRKYRICVNVGCM